MQISISPSGVLHQLFRAHDEANLPSVFLQTTALRLGQFIFLYF